MSLLYKCDRCKSTFEPPTLTPDEKVDPLNIEDRELYYRIFRANNKDLCDICVAGLMNFMQKPDLSTVKPID